MDHRETWERYVASWQAASAPDKLALFEGCLSPSCHYTDPLVEAQGWQALIAYMLDFQRQVPGGHFATTYFLAHHRRSIARWQLRNGAQLAIGEGFSYGEYDQDGRLVAMTGFFEAPVS